VLGSGAAALLRGHGDLVVGPDVPTVVSWAVMLKENAEVLHLALAQGEVRHWSAADLAEWQRPQRDQVGPAAAAALARRRWEYLEARVTGRWNRHVYGNQLPGGSKPEGPGF
jgi:hypothetical protein